MTRPTLAKHEREIALLQQAHEHGEKAVLDTLNAIQSDVAAMRAELHELKEKQSALELAWAKMQGTVHGVKIGWAAAFTFIGAAISIAAGQIMGFFK